MADRIRALRRIHLQTVDRIPHWEHFSNPDFIELITGIDPYEKPRSAALAAYEKLPIDLGFPIPASDDPIPRPTGDETVHRDPEGHRMVRWGDGYSWHWDWGKRFATIDDVLAYDPLTDMDQRDKPVVASLDYSKPVAELAADLQGGPPPGLGAPRAGTLREGSYYNTLFMWPLLTFGWELFLRLVGEYPHECRRLLAGFAERSRRLFQAYAMTDIDVMVTHDDICCASGPVCSPQWLRENVYPYYEEFFALVREQGIKVLFITDGNADKVADDLFACGADGLVSEPFTDWKAIAARHPDKVLVGEGDNRVLMRNDPAEIEAHVKDLCEMGRRYPGYFLCMGNHIPWNIPAEAVKRYFDYSDKYGWLT